MKVLDYLKADHFFKSPVVLTIGFFDGVHLGHSKIFKKMKSLKESGTSIAISFKNHPTTIIRPHQVTQKIFPYPQKVNLLRKEHLDVLFLLEFTEELRQQSADDFISFLIDHCPFDHLVLGANASIGKDREGSSERLTLLSKKYGFTFHEVDSHRYQGQVISSTRIRELIKIGDLKQAEQLLNRDYSLLLPIVPGEQQGQVMGFPTLNFEIEGLAHPPLGVYEVKIKLNDKNFTGIANLGYAPTLKDLKNPLLEVHIMQPFDTQNIECAEITFKQFIRPEKKFHSMDELKAQIKKDIDFICRNNH